MTCNDKWHRRRVLDLNKSQPTQPHCHCGNYTRLLREQRNDEKSTSSRGRAYQILPTVNMSQYWHLLGQVLYCMQKHKNCKSSTTEITFTCMLSSLQRVSYLAIESFHNWSEINREKMQQRINRYTHIQLSLTAISANRRIIPPSTK